MGGKLEREKKEKTRGQNASTTLAIIFIRTFPDALKLNIHSRIRIPGVSLINRRFCGEKKDLKRRGLVLRLSSVVRMKWVMKNRIVEANQRIE